LAGRLGNVSTQDVAAHERFATHNLIAAHDLVTSTSSSLPVDYESEDTAI
jgi:hypothetical protein